MTEQERFEPGRRQPVLLSDLTPQQQQERTRLRLEHVLEVETGFRGGDPALALPGEPRAWYDPAVTTLRQRRRAKVAELHALNAEEARLLGWAKVSERTLERLAAGLRRDGMVACVDRRWVRRRSGHPSVSAEVAKAILAVRAETLHRSTVSMKTREALIHQYVRETFGLELAIPSYPTLRRVWVDGSALAVSGNAMRAPLLRSPPVASMSWCTGQARSSSWTPRSCRSRSATPSSAKILRC